MGLTRIAVTLGCAAVVVAAGACRGQAMDAVGMSSPKATPASPVDAAAVVPAILAPDFRDRMTQVVARQLSEGHGERYDGIVWASADARDAWQGGGDMPEGAVLVEELLQRADKGDRAAGFLVMEKRAGGWRFQAGGPDGEVADDAHMARCATCHAEAPRDDVFRVVQKTMAQTTAPMTATVPTSVATAAATYDARSAGTADAASSR